MADLKGIDSRRKPCSHPTDALGSPATDAEDRRPSRGSSAVGVGMPAVVVQESMMDVGSPRQLPLVAVIKRNDEVPLEQAQAEAMMEVAAVMRRQALRLPERDDLRAELLESAHDYCVAAQLAWPPCGAVRPAALPRTG